MAEHRGAASTTVAPSVGFSSIERTLCIGLDLAWFGGSARDRSSQFDFIAGAVLGSDGTLAGVHHKRVSLVGRDAEGLLTTAAISELIKASDSIGARIVIAVDAPLQTNRTTTRKSFRGCELLFNTHRKRIDRDANGSDGWHPNLQPGTPLADRVQKVLGRLAEHGGGFELWSGERSQSKRLVIECFPAEAIWAAKRLGRYPEAFTAARAKAYKAQKGARLNAIQVRTLVEDALLDAFKFVTRRTQDWTAIISATIDWMLADTTWQKNGLFRGGKLLDDVVDSTICLATAISYAFNRAHVWQDPSDATDGHIIGPGLIQQLTAKGAG